MKLFENRIGLLKSNLRKSDKYTFSVDGFRFPTLVNGIDLETIRSNLINTMSNNEKSYIGFLDSRIKQYNADFECIYFSQIPFIVDKPLWKECCIRAGCYNILDRNNLLYQNRNALYPDLYFPRLNKIIEVDYYYTHPCREYDIARDFYFKAKYDIDVLRLVEFNSNSIFRQLDAEIATLNLIKNSRVLFHTDLLEFNYDDILIKNFTQDYTKEEFEIAESIVNQFGDRSFIRLNYTNPLLKNRYLVKRVKEILGFFGIRLAW
jgi:hypothetical protein